ncbi:LPS export ABC transporter permease LptG [Burkholderia stabilis]|uniref:Lipopolysaccharide export system permease protein lptG,lipopolysaccharide ABC transporter permease,Predicted permeases,Predicted permease YjgP/YjgQ family n=1 Tax=Burkholderia stabilis TaxID=95485 RepID=A0AAJ5NDU9_9BURK|nr:LPS export ABC transporter permease LptG [Burkholderia stabilis]AOR68989.1 LPS export ABC transporter permease LptG [Burkholderia stabilis]VBB13024.1 Lipopolysaccharide export system permease protein lptG,lipopolysaccharide ABC transporter permease,Predicted permeases,Predicted permease YjgP/YjgQ family [Burkholderia stabilis]HDR9495913.1 LPS export ABC transporter permease LptG [Burkholderia stabilis]HDR9523257.1 LPS export ABC transporter permease LptG [Burkholderia stabilis]HDR9531279.1 
MRLYEKYFARQIYVTFVFILFAFSGLFFFFDLISELNSVGHGNYKFGYAVLRVALQTPSRFYEIIPVAALISAIYVFAQMAANSEFTIFRVSGLATNQALRSLLKIGVPLVIITYLIGEFVGPYADQLSERVRLQALGASVSSNFQSGVWVKDTLAARENGEQVTRFVNVGSLSPDSTISNVRIYEFDSKFQLQNVRIAQTGRYEPPGHWLLKGVTETELTPIKPISGQPPDALNPVYRSQQVSLPEYRLRSDLTPQILSVLLVSPERMSIFNLFRYIQHLRENQQDTQRYDIALWRKLLYPFAVFVMLVLSLPFAYLHTRAGVVGVKVFGGIMLGMSFQLLNTLFSHIGTLNTWPAPLTAATPGLIYLALGLFALKWVDRH